MRNYLFEVSDKKYIVKAENENYADVLREFFDDVSSVRYLGWCTDEVAEELGYEVYKKPTPKGLTIKDFYEWAVKNGVKDCPLRAFNPYINEYDQIRKTDVVVQTLTDNPEKSVYIYLY